LWLAVHRADNFRDLLAYARWKDKMTSGWTPERRARQAVLIRNWQSWLKSTGPKTRAGKARVGRNAFKGGYRPLIRGMAKALREQRRALGKL
jgi:hypothetical protein